MTTPSSAPSFSPNVTAIFAPGAKLIMRSFTEIPADADGAFTVQGSIQAGLHQIFEAAYDPPVRGVPVAGPVRHSVLFQTDRIKEVYPEWFGAQSKDETHAQIGDYYDSFPGLQSAIDAAIHYFQYVAPIPLVLTGRYQITRPLYIGVRPWSDVAPLMPFILRGRAGPSVAANGIGSLSPHPEYEAPPAATRDAPNTLADFSLLIIRGPKAFLIEDLNFNAALGDGNDFAFKAFSCVRAGESPHLLPGFSFRRSLMSSAPRPAC